jgi:phosphoserine phosphatase RsbU/P
MGGYDAMEYSPLRVVRAMPSLILMKAPDAATPTGKTYPLASDSMTLGREESCEIVIPNFAVSRRHAVISRASGQYVIDDLKSRNRTYVNNREISGPTTLKNDDRIKICDFLFRFYDESVQQAAPKKPLPVNPVIADETDDEEEGAQSTIEHTLPQRTQGDLLSTQPSEKLRVLLEISTSLSQTLELEALFVQIAEKVLNVFRQADRVFMIQVEDTEKLVPRIVRTRRSVGGDDHKFSKSIVRRCLTTRESYLSEDASSDTAFGAAQSIAEFRIRSVMCVPLLTAEGQPIGAIQLDTQDRAKKFKQDDLQLLNIVANLAAVAIDKARLLEHMFAQQKQQKEIELAQSTPQMAGYECYGVYSAALTVGGDYYDFIYLPDGRLAIVLGDVAGKGVPASLLMAKLSAEARYCMLTQPSPSAAVNLLNESLIRGGIGDRFVTLALVIVDPKAHRMTIVNAGHINPVLYRPHHNSFEDIVTNAQSGIPLGIMSDFPYEAFEFPFNEGDSVLLFTDGVTDATAADGSMFDFAGIKNCLMAGDQVLGLPTRPKAIGERVMHSVRKHLNGRPQNDDIAIVCVGRLLEGASPASGTGTHQHMVPSLNTPVPKDQPSR